MARPPTRAAAQKQLLPSLADASDDDDAAGSSTRRAGRGSTLDEDPFHESDEDHRPTKRASKGKGKGRMGKLAYFSSMPLDILSEICSHLDLKTLLAMSRVSKNLRAFFMSKSSKALWVLARREQDFLPELSTFSEPELTSLLFDRDCHVCGKGRAVIVSYFVKARLCKACQKKNLLQGAKLRRKVDEPLHPLALTCSLMTHYSPSSNQRYASASPFYFMPQVLEVSRRLIELDGDQDLLEADGLEELGSDADEDEEQNLQTGNMSAVYDEAHNDPELELDDDELVVPGESTLQRYVRIRKRIVEATISDARKLLSWERQSKADRAAGAKAIGVKRAQDIKAKMLSLGYTNDELAFLSWDRSTKELKPLTDKVWNRISPHLILEADRRRQVVQQHEARARLTKRRDSIRPLYDSLVQSTGEPDSWVLPSFHRFAALACVKVFYEPEDAVLDPLKWAEGAKDRQDAIDRLILEDRQCLFVKMALATRKSGGSITPALDAEIDAYLETKPDRPQAELVLEADDDTIMELLGRFESLFQRYDKFERYPQCQEEARRSYFTPQASVPMVFAARHAKLSVVDSHAGSLEEPGARFNCDGCQAAMRSSSFYVPPVKKADLSWEEVMVHVRRHHDPSNGYSYHSTWEGDTEARVKPRITFVGGGPVDAA